MPRYTEVGSGETENGNPWRIGLVRGRLVVMWGRLTMTPTDQEAFAEAVARAVTPGQVTVAAFPCCKHCEADNAEYGTSCSPPRHLTRCASGCDDAGQATSA